MAAHLKVKGIHHDEKSVLVDATATPPTYETRTVTTLRVQVTDADGNPAAAVIERGAMRPLMGADDQLAPTIDLVLSEPGDADGIKVGDVIPVSPTTLGVLTKTMRTRTL